MMGGARCSSLFAAVTALRIAAPVASRAGVPARSMPFLALRAAPARRLCCRPERGEEVTCLVRDASSLWRRARRAASPRASHSIPTSSVTVGSVTNKADVDKVFADKE